MGTLRKLRKTIKSEPMIVFVPSDADIYSKIIAQFPDVIIVTDRKIYDRVYEVAKQALEQNRNGISKGEPK